MAVGIQGSADDWRLEMLAKLDELVAEGAERFSWITAGDAHVCQRCAARVGKTFTAEEIRRELRGEFCRPGDMDGRCRCTILEEF